MELNLFNYNHKTKISSYSGNKSPYDSLIYQLWFLEEKYSIAFNRFNSLNELWFKKEIKNQSLMKLNLDIIESLISKIKVQILISLILILI